MTTPITPTTASENEPKILIIGAGPSGIACATKLLDYGFEDVTILEAESRIGGRIHTITFGDNVIDLGAQWCHGEQNNIVYELAQKHNLLESTGDIYEKYRCVRSNRDVVPESVAQRLKHIVNSSLITRQKELIDYKGSLGDYLTHKFYSELSQPAFSDIEPAIAREFFENYKKFESSVEAADTLDEVSGVGYLEYAECEGELLLNWKDKGFVEFLRLLLQTKDTGSDEHGVLEGRIQLGKQVKRICWQRMDAKTLVQCADGEQLLADHVVLTVSLGVLKARLCDLFEPTLPIAKQDVINGLAFGTVNKIFIEFPTKFWPDDWTGFTFLWREQDLDEIRGTKRAWLEDVFGFYEVSYQPRVLCGWVIGESARYMEQLPKSEILAGCLCLIKKFLCWPIPEPLNFASSAWFSNANFRGSYSFRSIKTEQVGASAKALADPLTLGPSDVLEIGKMNGNGNLSSAHNNDNLALKNENFCDDNKPVLQFAGEASSEHFYSTVHGAVEAGWREAKRLADFYGISNDTENTRKSKS